MSRQPVCMGGTVRVLLQEGRAYVLGVGISWALGQQWGSQVSYRDCHSFTITNAGLSETATCKWCMSGWQPATPPPPPQTLQPRITFDCRGHRNAYLDTCHIISKNNKQPISNISSGSRTRWPACFWKIRMKALRSVLAGNLFTCFFLVIKKQQYGRAQEQPHHVGWGEHTEIPKLF